MAKKVKTKVHRGNPYKSHAVLTVVELKEGPGLVIQTYGDGVSKIIIDAIVEGIEEIIKERPDEFEFEEK